MSRHSQGRSVRLKGISSGRKRRRIVNNATDPSRNDYGFAKSTALFDKVGIDLLRSDIICIAADLVSV
jgi:hypothetical protein